MKPKDGVAIAIAWPKDWGKQTNAWYDPLMRWIGFNKDFQYRVGHAALVLVNARGDCHYFDCGRFHTPIGRGRIRDVTTDPGMAVHTKATFVEGKTTNLTSILQEIQLNKTSKGTGPMLAACCTVDFASTFIRVKAMQAWGHFPFGPFTRTGTNCCRMVQKSVLAGNPAHPFKWGLRLLFPIIPAPITLFRLLGRKTSIPAREQLDAYPKVAHLFEGAYHSTFRYDSSNVHGTLPAPAQPASIPSDAQWLAGEALGSWFHIAREKEDYIITRYSPEGKPECSGKFYLQGNNEFDIHSRYSFTYLSHCSLVTILQGGRQFIFKRPPVDQ